MCLRGSLERPPAYRDLLPGDPRPSSRHARVPPVPQPRASDGLALGPSRSWSENFADNWRIPAASLVALRRGRDTSSRIRSNAGRNNFRHLRSCRSPARSEERRVKPGGRPDRLSRVLRPRHHLKRCAACRGSLPACCLQAQHPRQRPSSTCPPSPTAW